MNESIALMLRYLDGDLTDGEVEKLDRMIVESPEAAKTLARLAIEQAHLGSIANRLSTSHLTDDLQQVQDVSDSAIANFSIQYISDRKEIDQLMQHLLRLEQAAEPITLAQPEPRRQHESGQHHADRLSTKQIAALLCYMLTTLARTRAAQRIAAAAILVIVVTLFFVFGPNAGDESVTLEELANETQTEPSSVEPLLAVATLTAEHDAKWDRSPYDDLYAGQRFTLSQGFAEITTKRGAVVILQAPATIELLDNDNALRLHAGKLVGICETDSSKGFAVQTDYCTVVDIGTEFGVSVLPTGVEATVFVGEIAVQTPNEPTAVVTHNQTARLSIGRDGTTLVVEDKLAQGYTRWQPRPAVITSATLNDERFNLEIVAQGIYEDALMYSDRDYQFNGVDKQGIPAALLGGDVVRMPADARQGRTLDIGEIRVDVELSQPCAIYLIAAPTQGSLDWVKRDYELTPMRVGQDQSESFVREQAPVGLGVGPGESIDEVMHVWKRKQPATGRVTFGPAHDQSMYSIVAVPTDNDAN